MAAESSSESRIVTEAAPPWRVLQRSTPYKYIMYKGGPIKARGQERLDALEPKKEGYTRIPT